MWTLHLSAPEGIQRPTLTNKVSPHLCGRLLILVSVKSVEFFLAQEYSKTLIMSILCSLAHF